MPEFEDRHLPELPGAISDSHAVFLQQLPHPAFRKVSSLQGLRLQQNVQQGRRGILTEPMTKGHGKALLRTVYGSLGDFQALGQRFQYILKFSTSSPTPR